MKPFDWSEEKNRQLKLDREVGFEEVVNAINSGCLLDEYVNPQQQYINQKVYIVEISGYVYAVPYVEDEEKKFLKTIYPSRKLTKKYLIDKEQK